MLKKICSKDLSHNNFTYYCEMCDYGCNKLFLWKQHEGTKKHQKKKCSKMLKKYAYEYTCKCGKKYRHIQSFNRHERNCAANQYENQPSISVDKEKEELRGMITTLINQNNNIIMENQEIRNMVKDMIPRIGNTTTINNKFNLQVFLNEECKDALNLTDFVETLKLELTDLNLTRENGYVIGIANIFLKGLKELDLHKRPIHCCDIKRDILYVKDNDTWEKDNKDKMKEAITTVAKKQVDKIKEWELNNPDWKESDSGKQMYLEMVSNIIGSEDDEKDNNKIIKTIAKEVIIEK